MRTRSRFLLLTLALSMLVAMTAAMGTRVGAQDQPPETVRADNNATLGIILVNHDGYTLYMRTDDMPGTSICNGPCADVWPPLQPPSDGNLSLNAGVNGSLDVFTRDDGTQQVEYDGMPLYTFANDMNPGDTNGQGIDNVWFAAVPESQ
ncbi:MAG: COG4315 family predicted lipoprotein [Dehalococcoidia bacterium]